MAAPIGTKVIAIQSAKSGIVHTYGVGVYQGDLIPNVEPFKSSKHPNPCILLDNNTYVWGFQCWWGPEDQVRTKMYEDAKKIVTVKIEKEEVKPLVQN